ncbi:MAG: family 1 glycosylhydrolase [Actinomycetota bacterium]|nr:family 1 glycosylhydrolase [Actinomycetota bacterium]
MNAIEVVGGFESTYQPAYDVDVAETTGHVRRWKQDLGLLRSCGVRRIRYPVRWHRIQPEVGRYDWGATDRTLGWLRGEGFRPIVDLLHHTSYPKWLEQGFADRRFAAAYLRYLELFARRYPWVEEYTLFNEPFATLFLAGHQGVWPPYLHGVGGLVRLFYNVLPPLAEASRMYRELLPDARHVHVDTCERHSGGRGGEAYAALANDRRFFVLDLLLGRPLHPERPFVGELLRAGGEELLGLEAGHIDVLGLDYYAHSEWRFVTGAGIAPSPTPAPLSALISDYWDRYRLPCMLSETNIRGFSSDRASWLKYTLEQCELAVARGVPLAGYCWFPFIDSCDWDSLLSRSDGSIDPVGVYWLDERLERRPSSMSVSYALAAGGAPSRALPAYRFQPPVSDWLEGFLPHMRHWDWRPPPMHELRCSVSSVSRGADGRR